MVLPGPRRFENRRQVASGKRPHCSGGNSARKRLSSKNFPLEGDGAGNGVILFANAMVRSSFSPPVFPAYLDFPGKKLTIFSPSLISAISRGRGTLSICEYQRSTSSVNASISFSRLLATGLTAGSSAASETQTRK